MRAGSLRHLLIIEEKISTVDGYAGRSDTWTEKYKVLGSLNPLTGREFFAAQQYESEVNAKAEIRYEPGITNAMRLKHEDLFYNIVFVQNSEFRNRRIVLMLSEGLRD
jgi:SPP1 family predicted phage head-tail adaptor